MKRHRGRDDGQKAGATRSSKEGRLSFASKSKAQSRGTAKYAYGGYGRREPGHARSDPYPVAPHIPDERSI